MLTVTRRPRRTARGARKATSTTPEQSSATSEASFYYIESSALLAALLEGDPAAREALRFPRCVTSALTFVEAARGLVRARVAGRITTEQERAALRTLATLERYCDVVELNEEVLSRARLPFPIEPIRTLDALHIATAELLGKPPQLITIVTRDDRVRNNARALGYSVL